tara:strand:- start:911 stop:1402 length:492 start_codon:yes stop_codon:yes gene_type:complete
MSRIARAARVASRQRVETVGNGSSAPTNKAIQTAETGELYLIDHDHGSTLTITLPPKQDGAYFKFIWKTLMDTASAAVKITTHEDTDGDLVGSVFEQVTGGSNADSAVQQDGSNADPASPDHQVTISKNVHQGSYIEFYCDGSVWYAHGMLNVDAVGRAVFGT